MIADQTWLFRQNLDIACDQIYECRFDRHHSIVGWIKEGREIAIRVVVNDNPGATPRSISDIAVAGHKVATWMMHYLGNLRSVWEHSRRGKHQQGQLRAIEARLIAITFYRERMMRHIEGRVQIGEEGDTGGSQ